MVAGSALERAVFRGRKEAARSFWIAWRPVSRSRTRPQQAARHLSEDDRYGRRLRGGRLSGRGGCVSRRKRVRKAMEVARKAVAKHPKDRRSEADARRPTGGHRESRRRHSAGKMPAELRGTRRTIAKFTSRCRQIYIRLHRWEDAAGARQGQPLTTKQEDRIYLFFLNGELRSGKNTIDEAET